MLKLLKIEKLSESNLINTAVFAAIWGLAEISLGTFLHASKIPFRGAIMSLLATAVLVCAKVVLKYKGSLILLGIVTATFRLFLGVGFNITPFAAIIIESVIAEIVINKFGFRRTAAVLTGTLIMVYSITHGLIMQALFLGIDIYKMYYELILKVTNKAGLSEELVLILILLIPVIQIGLGAASGSFGFSVGNQINNMIED
ncbi:MAG: hypothetical protein HND52_00580 [Ignavibacteriae bacterium]|jgi:hypothetical protein|nr:hypothetical protein [Ignavibacteriota bacterium]NOG96442.1 hypothetical protein [Ignavibacteriota bacterium]